MFHYFIFLLLTEEAANKVRKELGSLEDIFSQSIPREDVLFASLF